MKYSSDLVFATARSLATARLDGTEGELELPTTLLPTLSLQGPTIRNAGFVAAAIQRESFNAAMVRGLAASQPVNTDIICTFGEGLWRVEVRSTMVSSFTEAFDGTRARSAVRLLDPGGTAIALFSFLSVLNVPQHIRLAFDWMFSEDSWRLDQINQATGVGETREIASFVSVARLL